jgi:hypothetical protein
MVANGEAFIDNGLGGFFRRSDSGFGSFFQQNEPQPAPQPQPGVRRRTGQPYYPPQQSQQVQQGWGGPPGW